jgi:hypothetical protein
MTTPDFPDWQQAVAIVDTAAQLTAGAVVLSTGQSTPSLDTSDVNTVLIEIAPPQAAAAGKRYELFLLWQEAGVNVFQEVLTYHSALSYDTALSRMMWIVPARAATLTVLLRGSDASTSSVIVSGSTRALAGGEPQIFRGNVFRRLLAVGTTSIPAGGSIGPFYVPPSARAISARIGGTNNLVSCSISAVDLVGIVPTANLLWDNTATGGNDSLVNLPVPSMGLEITLANADVAARSANIVVWDVS